MIRYITDVHFSKKQHHARDGDRLIWLRCRLCGCGCLRLRNEARSFMCSGSSVNVMLARKQLHHVHWI
jgi:hypothetical protein